MSDIRANVAIYNLLHTDNPHVASGAVVVGNYPTNPAHPYVDTPNLPYARRHTVEAQQLERSCRSELPYYGWEIPQMTATFPLLVI